MSSIIWGMPHPLQAASKSINPKAGIFLSQSSAKRIVTDLRYCNEKLPNTVRALSICDKEVDNLKEQKRVLNMKISGYEKDITALEKTEKDYKDKYAETAKKLEASENDKPSRLTWFGVGFISALILGMLSVYAIKK